MEHSLAAVYSSTVLSALRGGTFLGEVSPDPRGGKTWGSRISLSPLFPPEVLLRNILPDEAFACSRLLVNSSLRRFWSYVGPNFDRVRLALTTGYGRLIHPNARNAAAVQPPRSSAVCLGQATLPRFIRQKVKPSPSAVESQLLIYYPDGDPSPSDGSKWKIRYS